MDRYNYLYSKEELKPWSDKVKQLSLQTVVVRGYFNNRHGARAVLNALVFKEMLDSILTGREKALLQKSPKLFFSIPTQNDAG